MLITGNASDLLKSYSTFWAFYGLMGNLVWGIIWGALIALLVVKFYNKFPFKTLFGKVFCLRLIIDILYILFASFAMLFWMGPTSYSYIMITAILTGRIIASLVYSIIISKKIIL